MKKKNKEFVLGFDRMILNFIWVIRQDYLPSLLVEFVFVICVCVCYICLYYIVCCMQVLTVITS